jgi:hypothetical protein
VLQDGHRTSDCVINTSGKASNRLFQHSVFLRKWQGTHTPRNSGVTQLKHWVPKQGAFRRIGLSDAINSTKAKPSTATLKPVHGFVSYG